MYVAYNINKLDHSRSRPARAAAPRLDWALMFNYARDKNGIVLDCRLSWPLSRTLYCESETCIAILEYIFHTAKLLNRF